MKIYKVKTCIWTYWKGSCESGRVYGELFFAKKENAEKAVADYEENPYFINYHNEKESVGDDGYYMGWFEMEEIETED